MAKRALRRTKILATMGPSTDAPDVLERLVDVGVDAFRINCSHGTAKEREQRVTWVRQISAEKGKAISVLFDLQGPKIRISRFRDSKVLLENGSIFALDSSLPSGAGDVSQVGLTYQQLPSDVKKGDELLLDDGRIILKVEATSQTRVDCRVKQGGELSNNKGINLKGGGLSATALTDKDKQDIKQAVRLGVDFVAISFPRTADDIRYARQLLEEAGADKSICIVAKIERAEAVVDSTLIEIIEESDLVMVARGDLGVEVGDAQLPALQKKIISKARTLNKGVITATQMMDSMTHSPLPTRAEIFDVANAVLDGTDAVMLSAETATGHYPVEVVVAMDRVCRSAEKQRSVQKSAHRLDNIFEHKNESIAMASMYLVNHLSHVAGIASLTESGDTPVYMSRISSGKPIFAVSLNERTYWRMSLYRGVFPILLQEYELAMCGPEVVDLRHSVLSALVKRKLLYKGERVIITSGISRYSNLGTNTLEILQVE